MQYGTDEEWGRLTGSRSGGKDPADVLRTWVWLEAAFLEHGKSRSDVADSLSARANSPGARNEPTGIVNKWLKGKHVAKPHSVAKLAKVLCGSDEVYHLPVFDLLRNKRIKKSQLNQWVKPYRTTWNGLEFWEFPQHRYKESGELLFRANLLNDSKSLLQRGDIYGFIGILYLVRKAEADNDVELHLEFMKDAYTAFPAAFRHPNFRPRWRQFYDCLFWVHARVPMSLTLCRPKKSVLESQIYADQHTPCRVLRPRNKKGFRFTELELPYAQPGF